MPNKKQSKGHTYQYTDGAGAKRTGRYETPQETKKRISRPYPNAKKAK